METGLQTVNQQCNLSEWAERVSACRSSGLSAKIWCRENGVSEQPYYKWQRRLYELAKNQQENRFAEVAPRARNCSGIAVTVQLGGMELEIHNGADAPTVEAVLRAVKSCRTTSLEQRRCTYFGHHPA